MEASVKLHEYQSKQIFAQYGIPIPKGEVASTPEEARQIAADLGRRVVVKSQVLVGGRGKAGGVKVANTPDEAEQVASKILGMNIKGLTVRKVLVDEAADIQQEIYLGVVIDRAARRVTMMASAAGGMDIEEVARTAPEKIIKVPDRSVPRPARLSGAADCVCARAEGRSRPRFQRHRPRAVQSVPRLRRQPGRDQSAGHHRRRQAAGRGRQDRHRRQRLCSAIRTWPPCAMWTKRPRSEAEARKFGLTYIQLDGEIGCMVNGAGLAMTTMDIVKLFGGSPANFLDIGGGASADKVAAALRIILADPNVKAVLFNIFGGITRCDEVARGIVAALEQVPTQVPMVVRLVGTNEEEGRAILAGARRCRRPARWWKPRKKPWPRPRAKSTFRLRRLRRWCTSPRRTDRQRRPARPAARKTAKPKPAKKAVARKPPSPAKKTKPTSK